MSQLQNPFVAILAILLNKLPPLKPVLMLGIYKVELAHRDNGGSPIIHKISSLIQVLKLDNNGDGSILSNLHSFLFYTQPYALFQQNYELLVLALLYSK